MKVVIMAGGFGKRISGMDSTVPKPLIPIAGKPVLQWEIECLLRQGFTEIILTVCHMAEKIESYFKDGGKFGCHITYYKEDRPIGNAGALFKLCDEGRLEGDFLLLNADSMFDVDFGRMISFHSKSNALATLLTHPNSHPFDSGLIVCADNYAIEEWYTKEDIRPKWYKNRVNAGIHIINTELLKRTGIKAYDIDEWHKVDLDRDVLKPLLDTRLIFAYDSPEYVKDMGTPERFEQVCEDVEQGRVEDRNLRKKQKAFFLDRDGTINKHIGFLKSIDDFELIDGVAEAIRLINESGYLAIVVTNQPVIARGEMTVVELDRIHNKMETLLGEKGAYLDAIKYCPHHPDSGYEGEIKELKIECNCRKPKPGLILQAVEEYNISAKDSYMVGDSWRDIAAGLAAGTHTILLAEKEMDEEKMSDNQKRNCRPEAVYEDLCQAVKSIIGVI